MLFRGREEFAGRVGQGAAIDAAEAKRNFEAVLSRARPQELAHDYLDGGWASPALIEAVRERARSAEMEHSAEEQGSAAGEEKLSVEEIQRRARENWLALKSKDPELSLSIEEQQRRARERWRHYQQSKGAEGERGQEASRDKSQGQEHEKPADSGIDDDLGM